MTALTRARLSLATGVELDVWEGGAGEPLIFLHGFPESHRTWANQMADLARDHRVIAPDQRGFARSSKPEAVADYAIEHLVGDVIALADALELGRFTLVAHDWGGAVGWATALTRPNRVARLVIANAPHPLIFQRSLIEDPAQRAASQYITAFRSPTFDAFLAGIGVDGFFDRTFAPHVTPGALTAADRAAYLDDWGQPGAMTGMLNWYRASGIVVPAPDEDATVPEWTTRPFPPTQMPVLVVWGTRDTALLPVQLDGLDALVPDLTVVLVDAGHFVPWEKPEPVTAAVRAFLAGRPV